MFSLGNLCSKSVSTLDLALSTMFRYENSLHSCFFGVCIFRPNRPVTMKKTCLEENFEEIS